MSELEPTITELEPTATERLRALLDERGAEYELTAWSCGAAVWWRDSSGTMWRAHDNDEDELLSFYAYNSVTPEQAIAATLGQEDVYTREDMEGAFVSGYSLGSLPVGSDPRWDENRQTVDEHMAELGWVRKEAATLSDSDATEARRSDAVEVVRCRDCEHYAERINGCVEFGDESRGEYANVEPDGFCAWASRKESE